jgi:hypothetical protein
MALANLGLNDASINYEVALEVLGQKKQPFIRAINAEKVKPNPSAPLIAYCEARNKAISGLQRELSAGDVGTINAILDKDNPLFLG